MDELKEAAETIMRHGVYTSLADDARLLARAYLASLEQPANTVKVRIAVAVLPSGEWMCAGWPNTTDEEMRQSSAEFLPTDGERTSFIEAYVPLPEQTTVKASVVE